MTQDNKIYQPPGTNETLVTFALIQSQPWVITNYLLENMEEEVRVRLVKAFDDLWGAQKRKIFGEAELPTQTDEETKTDIIGLDKTKLLHWIYNRPVGFSAAETLGELGSMVKDGEFDIKVNK